MLDYFYAECTFNEVVEKYKNLFGLDLSYMKILFSEKPRNKDGKITMEFSSDEFGGSWTKNKIIYVNPYPEKVVEHWKLDMSPMKFLEWIIAHELAHEIWWNIATKELKDYILNLAKMSNFSTKYLDTVPKSKLDEETFAEFMAALLK